MTLRTAICDLLGVEHPVGNAGMAGVAHDGLCAAVAEAEHAISRLVNEAASTRMRPPLLNSESAISETLGWLLYRM